MPVQTCLLCIAFTTRITPIPRIACILVTGRNHVTQKFRYWNCTNDSNNAKFPHLSPVHMYIDQNLREWKPYLWKPRYAGTRCRLNNFMISNVKSAESLPHLLSVDT